MEEREKRRHVRSDLKVTSWMSCRYLIRMDPSKRLSSSPSFSFFVCVGFSGPLSSCLYRLIPPDIHSLPVYTQGIIYTWKKGTEGKEEEKKRREEEDPAGTASPHGSHSTCKLGPERVYIW